MGRGSAVREIDNLKLWEIMGYMKVTTRYKVTTYVMIVFFLGLSLICWFKKADDFSNSERRALAKLPELSAESIRSGEFMTEFETYILDQFPFRDSFRTLKAVSTFYVFGQKDNNDVYIADGFASKLEYPMKEEGMDRASARFTYVYDKYMADTDVKLYFSIIPDKNYFLAEENGYLSMDYPDFFKKMQEKTGFAEYIDIVDLLKIEDYYRTDTHWRQENLVPVAQEIGAQMGTELVGEYEVKVLDNPFYGVYYGQSALPLAAEEMQYLTNEVLEDCEVYDFENGKNISVYDMEKAYGKDPYEMFLSGSLSLLTIENPKATTDKELILFRDSFGSSIAPLFAEGYAKITLVDIRYIHPDMLGRYMEFTNQDVLFLYSTLVLNNGETIK